MATHNDKKVNNLSNAATAQRIARTLKKQGLNVKNYHEINKLSNDEYGKNENDSKYKKSFDTYAIPLYTLSEGVTNDLINRCPKGYKGECFIHVNYEHNPEEKGDISFQLKNDITNISLKCYKKGYSSSSKIQTCSNTIPSLALSFLYDSSGVGKYSRNNEKICMSGSEENKKQMLEYITIDYGERATYLFSLLLVLDRHYKPLIEGENTNYDAVKWKEACKNVGEEATTIMLELVSIIMKKDKQSLMKRVLNKMVNKDTYIAISMNNKYFSTFKTEKPQHLYKLLKENKLNISVCQSGKDKMGRGIYISVFEEGNPKMELSINMPFTINKNGAWQLSDDIRWCEIDKDNIPRGKLRPEKAKQMATSSNCYILVRQLVE